MTITDNEANLQCVLDTYNKVVKSDGDAADLLFTFLVRQGLSCGCGSARLKRSQGSRVFDCGDCNRHTHFTANTLFDGVARLAAWIGSIALIGNGVAVSANRLSSLFDIAPSTAHNMHKKIMTVMSEEMSSDASKVLSSMFDQIIFRRSRESNADTHPVDDGLNFFEPADCDAPFSMPETDNTELSDEEALVLDAIGAGPTSVDSLVDKTALPIGTLISKLTMLEMMGLARPVSADCYSPISPTRQKSGLSVSGEALPIYAEEIGKIVHFIASHYQGVSRKCLQIYMAAYWAFIDRVAWPATNLLQKCLEHEPISYQDLLAMKSPRFVEVKV